MDQVTVSMIQEFDKILEEYHNMCDSFNKLVEFVDSLNLTPRQCPVGYKIDQKYFYIITKCKNSNNYTPRTYENYYGLFDLNSFNQKKIPYITSIVDLIFIDNGYNIVARSRYSKIYKIMVDKKLFNDIITLY